MNLNMKGDMINRKHSLKDLKLKQRQSSFTLRMSKSQTTSQVIRSKLLVDICEGDQDMKLKLSKRLTDEKKRIEDKLVTQRL